MSIGTPGLSRGQGRRGKEPAGPLGAESPGSTSDCHSSLTFRRCECVRMSEQCVRTRALYSICNRP